MTLTYSFFQDYNAKLSDFGLAIDGPEKDQTHITTRVMGTRGYAAPEYIKTGILVKPNFNTTHLIFLLQKLVSEILNHIRIAVVVASDVKNYDVNMSHLRLRSQ